MLKHCSYALAAACCLLLAASPAAGQAVPMPPAKDVVEVTVAGNGMDKDEALRDAMRKALEQGAGTYIYSQSKTQDFVLVKDTILARAAGFIQSKTILSTQQMEDGTWAVKIKAVVSVKGIQDTWGVVQNLLKERGRPKIMVFINERIGREVVEDSTVQTGIENLLLKSGFLLVNKEQIKAIDKKDLMAAVAEDKPDKVQAIAKRFGAQLFISGSATASPGPGNVVGGIQLFPYEAEANVKCYRSDTAQLLSSIPGKPTRGVGRVMRSGAKQALDLQAQHVAPKVQYDILRFWQDALEGRGEVQLQVEGVTFKQYVELKKSLLTIKQVKDVTAKYANSNAECSIQSDVNAETLAEKLVEAINTLEITDVSQNVIKAKFKK